MTREGGRDPLTEAGLDLGVGLGHQRGIRLGVHGQATGQVAQHDRIGLIQQLQRELAQVPMRAALNVLGGHALKDSRRLQPIQ